MVTCYFELFNFICQLNEVYENNTGKGKMQSKSTLTDFAQIKIEILNYSLLFSRYYLLS